MWGEIRWWLTGKVDDDMPYSSAGSPGLTEKQDRSPKVYDVSAFVRMKVKATSPDEARKFFAQLMGESIHIAGLEIME